MFDVKIYFDIFWNMVYIGYNAKIFFDKSKGDIMKLIVEGLIKSYGKKEVIKEASYSFDKGMIYGIIGRNGVGKTTLFNTLIGNVQKDSGQIYITNGNDKRAINFEDIGMVSASPSLPEFLTGYEFIKCFMEIHTDSFNSSKIDQYFDTVKLSDDDRHSLIKTYSYGMRNKIQLLTCLIRKPSVILLDEPLTSFDIIVSHEIKELLLSMKKDHIILMSTHILQLAQDICDEIVILRAGKLHKTEALKEENFEFQQAIVSELREVNG